CFLLVKKEVRTSQKLYSSNPVKRKYTYQSIDIAARELNHSNKYTDETKAKN
ncbi:MAG: hypothetical protein ACI8RD_003420, partial [Bacillariaceae sp.]